MKVPLQYTVAQFEYCQSLMITQILSALRLLEDNQVYQMIKDNLDSFLQKREELIYEGRTKFREIASLLLRLEGDNCSDSKRVQKDYNLVYGSKLKTCYLNI